MGRRGEGKKKSLCMYVLMYVCVCMYVHMYLCLCVYIYACIYVCIYVCVDGCVIACVHIRMGVCMRACMGHVCVCECAFLHVCARGFVCLF